MSPIELSRLALIAAAAICVVVNICMLQVAWLDFQAVVDYPDVRGKRIVSLMHLKTELLLLLAQCCFLAVAVSVQLDLGASVVRGYVLALGILIVGISALCRYRDRRRFDAWQRAHPTAAEGAV